MALKPVVTSKYTKQVTTYNGLKFKIEIYDLPDRVVLRVFWDVGTFGILAQYKEHDSHRPGGAQI